MSSTPTPTIQGTQAPSAIELTWERYKSLFYVVVIAILGALVANYGIKKYSQGKADSEWTSFAASIGLSDAYTDQAKAFEGLMDRLADIDAGKLKAAAAAAPDTQRPYLQLAVASKAVLEKDWAGAESALKELETRYPNHVLVRSTPHPVQAQERIKDKDTDPAKPQAKPKKPEFKPAVAGSSVSQLREQIAAAKAYAAPIQFAKHEIPANAVKIKFEFGETGSFTMALMREKAEKHCDEVLKLAEAPTPIWVGLAIDEIRRPTKSFKQPRELHFGLESTREDDRAKWTDTKPSEHLVDFEANDLSHFPGAVSARSEADGKSCADRFWIAVDDCSKYDGERVIFAYVVEGLDDLKKICESAMTAQEEERGQGKPTETIRVTKVTVIKP